MYMPRLVLLGALLAAACPASAQWQWVDAQGRKVFSDTAPPPEVPPEKILRRPKAASDDDGQAPAPAAPAAAPQPTRPAPGTDPRLEEQKRRAEAEEAARQQQEEARRAEMRRENCARARRSKATLTSGQMLAHTNEKGERGFMNEATRQAELQRIDRIIDADCAN